MTSRSSLVSGGREPPSHSGVREELGEPPNAKGIPARQRPARPVSATVAVMLSELPNGAVVGATKVDPDPIEPGAEMAGAGNVAANGIRMVAQPG